MAARRAGVGAARRPRGTYLAALTFALVGAGGTAYVRDAYVDHESAAFRRAAATTGQAFDAAVTDLHRTVTALDVVGPRLLADPAVATPLLAPDRVRAVAVVGRAGAGGAPRTLAGDAGDPDRLARALRASNLALELARDTGAPHAGPAIDGQLLVAVPSYGDGPEPIATSERRTRLSGWALAVVDLDAFSAAFRSPDYRVVMQTRSAGLRRSDAVERTAYLANQPWTLSLTRVPTALPPVAWSVLVAGLLAALLTLVVGRRAERRFAETSRTIAARERETRTVAAIGPLLQQSLDLAEVLPAVAIRLSDEFDLVRFDVELLNERGALVEMFTLGGRAGDGTRDVPPGPARSGVPAGADVSMALLRGGRTIGRLRFASRGPLERSQLDALRAAADLIAVASYNVELYEREQATVRRLQELDRLKDAFLGTISHELRTPITAIGGFIRLLQERWESLEDPVRLDIVNRLGRNASSLGMLVDGLLDFARLERQAYSVTLAQLDLSELLARIVAQLLPLLGQHEVATDLPAGCTASVDPAAMERVVTNLLTNAAKFSPPGSRVDVSVRPDGPWVEVCVADRGPGIADEDRPRVFTRFYRGDSDAARSTRGAGIGLAVVRELTHQMGGTIEAQPNQPTGTRMVVRLPAAPAVPAPVPRTSVELERTPESARRRP